MRRHLVEGSVGGRKAARYDVGSVTGAARPLVPRRKEGCSQCTVTEVALLPRVAQLPLPFRIACTQYYARIAFARTLREALERRDRKGPLAKRTGLQGNQLADGARRNEQPNDVGRRAKRVQEEGLPLLFAQHSSSHLG